MRANQKGSRWRREKKRVKVKGYYTDNIKSKRVTVDSCSTDDSESKSVHKIDIFVNTRKVKYTNNKESVVRDIEVINVPGYFKLF